MKINRKTKRQDVVRYLVKTQPKGRHTANPKKYPQGYFKDKVCRISECENTFSPKAPSEHYCSDDCCNLGFTENYLKRTYNITLDQYTDTYISQGGRCKLCNKSGFVLNRNSKVKLCVDHCHDTNKFRGLLCHNCNRGLGLFNDKVYVLENAVKYLKV